MSQGLQVQRCPADVIGNAVHIAQIATEGVKETILQLPAKRNSGSAGELARRENTTYDQRSETVSKVVAARWG